MHVYDRARKLTLNAIDDVCDGQAVKHCYKNYAEQRTLFKSFSVEEKSIFALLVHQNTTKERQKN